MNDPAYQFTRCSIVHRMAPGYDAPVRCERAAGHEGDCRVTVQEEQWAVSPNGYEDHPPRRITLDTVPI